MFKLTRRYKVILNYVVGPLLFVLLSISIYNRIQHQENLRNSWSVIKDALSGSESWKFYIVILLSLVNWGLETRKWQVLVAPIEMISFMKAFKGVLSGLSLSLFVPNRVGEYVGRIAFMKEGNRLRSVSMSIVGGVSQLIVTLVGGIFGMLYLKAFILEKHYEFLGLPVFWINLTLALVTVGTALLFICYYRLPEITQWIESTKYGKRFKFFIVSIEDFKGKTLTAILSLSFLRYTVFIVQYVLLMQVFDVQIPWLDAVWLTCTMFLALAIIPTLPVAEIGLRGELSLQLFGLISNNVIGIVATAAGIWLINLIIPAIAGSLFILSIKLFRK